MKSDSDQSETLLQGASQPSSSAVEATVISPGSTVELKKQSWLGPLLSGLFLLLLLGTGILLVWQHDLVSDWFVLRGYTPPANIQSLAQDDTMTGYAKRLFYVNKPQVAERAIFNSHCSATDQVTVLGCYTGNRRGIYLYDVTDPRLAGIQQVTAAHEMLHQAYDRLSASERSHIDALLLAYSKTITDPSMEAKLASYQKLEPHDVVNEMHSVFGTEVSALPAELEQYYARYFTDRRKITQFQAQYQEVFIARQKQLTSYNKQLDALKKEIDTDKATIDSQEAALQAARSQLDAYTSSNQIAAYNTAVPAFNDKVDAYKTLVAQTNSLIDQYNQLISDRNAIAIQEQQLQQAIDSHATAVPQH